MPRRSQHEILVHDSDAFLRRFTGANRRVNPESRRRAIRKRRLKKELKRIFSLDADCEPQVYGIGIKELWDIDDDKHVPGTVIHTQGWPLDDADGGGFIYLFLYLSLSLTLSLSIKRSNDFLICHRSNPRW